MLAERLHMTVGQLNREMTSRELSLWMEWDLIKPATDDDWRFARLQREIGSILPAFDGKQPPAVEQYLPPSRRPPSGFTGLAMKQAFLASHAHLKGTTDER